MLCLLHFENAYFHILICIRLGLWLLLIVILLGHIPYFAIFLLTLILLLFLPRQSQSLILFVQNFFLVTILVVLLRLFQVMLRHSLFLFDVVRLHPYSLQLLIFFLCLLFLQHLIQINVFLCYILHFLVNLCILVLNHLILFLQMLLPFLLHHILETLVYFCIYLCIVLFHSYLLTQILRFLVLEILVSLTLDIVHQICLRIQF